MKNRIVQQSGYGKYNIASKLKEPQVIDIFTSENSNIILADKYNVDQSLISRIKNGKYWLRLTSNLTVVAGG